MHPHSANPAPTNMRRAVRAALILVPLFGLQHILIPFRPELNDPYEHLYQYVTVVIVSLQVINLLITPLTMQLTVPNQDNEILTYSCC